MSDTGHDVPPGGPLPGSPAAQAGDLDLEPRGAENGSVDASPSILDALRVERERKADAAPPALVLGIPGYGHPTRLAAVYRFPPSGYKAAIKGAEVERLARESEADLHGSADVLVACLASLVAQLPDGTLVNIDTEEPVTTEDVVDPAYPASRFNVALADKLGINVGEDVERKGRFICREVFSPGAQSHGRYEGDLSLIAQSNIVFAWLQGVNRERDEEQAGE